jgi:putative Mg2+ transporter-C (MgtC) family protein
MTIHGIATQDTDKPEKSSVVANVFASEGNDKFMNDIVARISIEPSVVEVSWERVNPG